MITARHSLEPVFKHIESFNVIMCLNADTFVIMCFNADTFVTNTSKDDGESRHFIA